MMILFLAALILDVLVVAFLGIAMATFVTALCKTVDWLFDQRYERADRRANRERQLLDVAMAKSIGNKLTGHRATDRMVQR